MEMVTRKRLETVSGRCDMVDGTVPLSVAI